MRTRGPGGGRPESELGSGAPSPPRIRLCVTRSMPVGMWVGTRPTRTGPGELFEVSGKDPSATAISPMDHQPRPAERGPHEYPGVFDTTVASRRTCGLGSCPCRRFTPVQREAGTWTRKSADVSQL